MSDVTALLGELSAGEEDALARLIPLLYGELRRLAARCMRDERAGHTLQPTALVHEAFLRLSAQDRAQWRNRAQFIGVAGQLMRRILVDHARKRHAAKRAAAFVTLNEGLASDGRVDVEEILAVDQALTRLRDLDAQQARIVELRYFAGLSPQETAEALGLSLRTTEREWSMAKAWLRAQLATGSR
jgi:RNA polymerase sigma factor (TIGR02999 family)